MYQKELTDILAYEYSSGSGDGAELTVVLSMLEKDRKFKKCQRQNSGLAICSLLIPQLGIMTATMETVLIIRQQTNR